MSQERQLSSRRVQLLREEAESGAPAALLALSNLAASGCYVEQSWDQAIDFVAAAARAGFAPALRVFGATGVATLSAEQGDRFWQYIACAAAEGDLPAKALVEESGYAGAVSDDISAVDALALKEALRLTPSLAIDLVNKRPKVGIVWEFMTGFECVYLRCMAGVALKPSLVSAAETPAQVQPEVRVSEDTGFSRAHQDILLARICARAADIAGFPLANAEPMAVVRYRPGGRFAPHYDTPADNSAANHEAGRHRCVSLVCYLNNDYEGGETVFVRLRLKIRGAAGDALLFSNVTDDGHRDPDTLHASMAVTEGEKWICALWFRGQPLNACNSKQTEKEEFA